MPKCLIDLISIISDILVGAAAIMAIIGLQQWRVELLGKTRFELARKMVLLAQEFRDKLFYARNPATFGGEAKQRVIQENEKPEESIILNEHYTRLQRLQGLQETLRHLHEASWEAEIILKPEHAELIKPFEEIYSSLLTAINKFYSFELIRVRNPATNVSLISEKEKERLHETIDCIGEDTISKNTDSAIEKLKVNLKKYLGK